MCCFSSPCLPLPSATPSSLCGLWPPLWHLQMVPLWALLLKIADPWPAVPKDAPACVSDSPYKEPLGRHVFTVLMVHLSLSRSNNQEGRIQKSFQPELHLVLAKVARSRWRLKAAFLQKPLLEMTIGQGTFLISGTERKKRKRKEKTKGQGCFLLLLSQPPFSTCNLFSTFPFA